MYAVAAAAWEVSASLALAVGEKVLAMGVDTAFGAAVTLAVGYVGARIGRRASEGEQTQEQEKSQLAIAELKAQLVLAESKLAELSEESKKKDAAIQQLVVALAPKPESPRPARVRELRHEESAASSPIPRGSPFEGMGRIPGDPPVSRVFQHHQSAESPKRLVQGTGQSPKA